MSALGHAAAVITHTWEQVLADVEADVRRNESLLREPSGDPGLAAGLAPAVLQLPAGEPLLPPFESMPAVPPELAERITELRLRVIALQGQLREEMAALRAAVVRTSTPPAPAQPASPAQFIDSLL